MLFKNSALAIISLLIYCLSLEAGFRVLVDDGMIYEVEMWKYAKDVKVRSDDPVIGHQHRPYASARLMGVDVRTDGNGFRGEDLPAIAPPGVARVAFVGDSITFGWGVEERETFTHLIIKDLVARGRQIEGFNAGVGNYNTTQELALLRGVGRRMQPDIIVLTYFINDAEPTQQYGRLGWLDWYSAVWTVLAYRADSLMRREGSRSDWRAYYRNLYKVDAPGWSATQKAIDEFARFAEESGAQLIVFNVPELRLLTPYPFSDITENIKMVVERRGVQFVDLLPSVEMTDAANLWVTVPDPHPNAKANVLFAQVMADRILPMLDRICEMKGKGCPTRKEDK